jgi:DNA-binding NarL/FixJ family response regulator
MRVLIIAETSQAAEVIRRGLRHAPSCQVLGYANGRTACDATVAQVRPDVIVLDDLASRDATLARIGESRGAAPESKLVLLSPDMDAEWLARAASAGINAAISKSTQLASIGMLVREVAAGNVYHAFAGATTEPDNSVAVDQLTTRELQILQLVAAGSSNGRIAAELWVTEQTVKFHLSNIYRKLGLANRTEASHYAHLHGLVELSPLRGRDTVPVAA